VASFGRDANTACADCTPYLLSLGLSKGQTSLVWVAGPLSGLIVQPIIGVVADQSTSKWGRRRPIIVIGSIIVALALLVLGFTKEIVASVGFNPETARILTIMLAVLSLYVVDFAINAGEQWRTPLGPINCALLTLRPQSCLARGV
jgi:solute carrier family 45 protein 1/2/4